LASESAEKLTSEEIDRLIAIADFAVLTFVWLVDMVRMVG